MNEEKALENLNNSLPLEHKYPEHDRRLEGWNLTGFVDGVQPKNKSIIPGEYYNMHYPYGAIPIWKYVEWEKDSKYTGAKLREIRKEKGVGRIHHVK